VEHPRPRRIEKYLTESGADPFDRWLRKRIDANMRGVVRVRLRRIEESGNFGDWGHVGGGVMELRFHGGPGHRIYYGIDEDTVILLGGGDKSTQQVDIEKAKERWVDYNA
jgi:putative addiction module killer protein